MFGSLIEESEHEASFEEVCTTCYDDVEVLPNRPA